MFPEKRENRQAVDRLTNHLSGLGRGDIIAHEDVASILGVEQQTERYYSLIERVKSRLLRDRGICLENIPAEGYALCTSRGQVEAARTQQVRAGRRVHKGLVIVASLPVDDCDAQILRAKVGIEERLAQIEKEMRQQTRLMSFLLRPRRTTQTSNEDAIAN